MPSRVPGLSAATLLAATLCAFPATSADWPHWRGPNADGISREKGLATTWPADGPPLLWRASTGVGHASPVVAGGLVYLFVQESGHETVTALEVATGEVRWRQGTKGGWSGGYAGTRATPWVGRGAIITLGGAGDLISRDALTGAERWKLNVLTATGAKGSLGWGTASSPTVFGNRVYVQGGKGGALALAVDIASGKEVWRAKANGVSGYAPVFEVKVGESAQVIVFGGTDIVGLARADGAVLWRHPWATSYDVNAATPIVRDNQLFVSSGYGHGSAMFKLTASGPTPLWETTGLRAKFPSPILDGDTIYGNDEGNLVALDWKTGKSRWRSDDRKLKLGAGGSLVRFGDRLVTFSERGRLSLVEATPAGVRLVSQVRPFKGDQLWASPVLSGGLLFVKSDAELVCYQVRAAK